MPGEPEGEERPEPLVSVVIPVYNPDEKLAECLDAIGRQRAEVPHEVIVVDSSDKGKLSVCEGRSDIVLIRSFERLYPGTGRNAGAAAAKGDILCFTDADCVPAYDWLSRIRAHRPDRAGTVVGGVILNGTPESAVGSAEYFSEFSAFLPAGGEREAGFLPTANMAVGRETFQRLGGFKDVEKGSDVAFGEECGKSGIEILFDPHIKVAHVNRTGLLPYLVNQRALGRGAGGNRVRFRTSGSLLARCPVLWPLVPAVRFARIAQRVAINGKGQRVLALKVSPLVLLGALCYGAGFASGSARALREKDDV